MGWLGPQDTCGVIRLRDPVLEYDVGPVPYQMDGMDWLYVVCVHGSK
jgi:hypothetical protein